jgi:putative ABC transport system permease protein
VAFETADGSGRVTATRTVTGVVRNPTGLHDDVLYEAPGTAADVDQAMTLATTSHPVTWAEVRALNALGFVVTSRYVIEHPPPPLPQYQESATVNATRIGIATVAVGLAVLEVVLLAGAAFAVGARRQRRDLAVVAAAGGDAADVAKVVLAGGVVLGLVGAITGVLVGIGVGRLALGETAGLTGHLPGPFDVRPLELLIVLAVGLLTGVVASVLPARTAARDDVVGALTGRRPAISSSRRVPIVGLVMIIGGTLLVGGAARGYHFRLILACAVIVELGFVLCAATIVAFVGRAARFLPLAPRLALRDAARHRGRSGPAVAAVMAAIAGSVAVSGFFVSTDHRDRADYLPEVRIGQAVVNLASHGAARERAAVNATAVMHRDLGVTRVIDVPAVGCVHVHRRCNDLVEQTPFGRGPIAVGDASLLHTLAGSNSSAAAAALAAGKIVLFVPSPQTAPPAGSSSWISQETDSGSSVAPSLPGASVYAENVGKQGASIAGIMSAATASQLRLRAGPDTEGLLLGLGGGVPSQSQEDHTRDQIGPSAGLEVGRPYHAGNYAIGLIALAVAAAIVTLGATAVSVGLSMAESQPDLVTMTAVGGRPLTRRLLVANQAGTVAVLGAVMGVAAGIVPAWAILRADRSVAFVMPWPTILVLVVGLPIVAMLGTAALPGSRTILNRRLT